jgi:hypothetical protein
MDTLLMSDSHQAEAPWVWAVAPAQATTLAAVPAPRWLQVHDGRVWATERRSGVELPTDIWLLAGQGLRLPAGSSWVIEAWPQARVSVLEAAPAPLGRRAGWRRAWSEGLRLARWRGPALGP